MITVREALEQAVPTIHRSEEWILERLAPKVEAALRAAYSEGYEDAERGLSAQPSTGVGMGILKFTVKS